VFGGREKGIKERGIINKNKRMKRVRFWRN
jgi:hypothetical protein